MMTTLYLQSVRPLPQYTEPSVDTPEPPLVQPCPISAHTVTEALVEIVRPMFAR